MRRILCLIPVAVAFTLLLTVPTAVMAQGVTGRNGTLNGTIADPDGAPLPGVTVTVSGPVLMTPSIAVTGLDGRFRAPALPPGLYTVEAALEGFVPMQQNDVRVTMGATLAVNFTQTPPRSTTSTSMRSRPTAATAVPRTFLAWHRAPTSAERAAPAAPAAAARQR